MNIYDYNLLMNETFDTSPSGENKAEEMEKTIEGLREENEKLAGENEQLRKENALLERSATKDPLTGVYNRRGFNEELIHVIRGSENEKERRNVETKQNAILILDIDDFKKINDSYGHEAGDEILRQAVTFLRKNTRKTDIICRWGGEEFVIVLQNINAKQVIQKFYNKEENQAQVGFSATVGGKEIPITFSGGATEIAHGETIEKTVANADEQLYRAKHDGKNRIYSPEENKP